MVFQNVLDNGAEERYHNGGTPMEHRKGEGIWQKIGLPIEFRTEKTFM